MRARQVTDALAGRRARTPLRVTLVGALLLLVTVALLVSGLAATAILRGYLLDRVDAQLGSAAHQLAEQGVGNGPDGVPAERAAAPDADGDGDSSRGPLPSAYVVEVRASDGSTVYGPMSNLVDPEESLPRLPEVTPPATGEDAPPAPVTVPARDGSGQWRVATVRVELADGSPGTLLVAQSLGDLTSTVERLDLLLAVVGVVTVLVLGALGYLLVRASLRPLVEVEETAAAIASGDLTQRVPEGDPRTEVGQLSLALNGMLAQIESAFAEREASEEDARRSEERMRRFVADASHELRTPLTSIRGFAELYRQGAVVGDDEVRRLVRRVEDEAARMGLLVEDLLLLARLDQQRPLERAPVDLLALATEAVEGARAVQPDRPVRLDVGTLEDAPVVLGDGPRLRQVLDNLLANALRHTPRGTPVTVRVSTSSADGSSVAELEVADEGPGMDPQDAARVFERFYRADPSRTRADGGTGLGLAIVASLVAAHDGTVDVDTAPGRGARFTVRLPLGAQPPAVVA